MENIYVNIFDTAFKYILYKNDHHRSKMPLKQVIGQFHVFLIKSVWLYIEKHDFH